MVLQFWGELVLKHLSRDYLRHLSLNDIFKLDLLDYHLIKLRLEDVLALVTYQRLQCLGLDELAEVTFVETPDSFDLFFGILVHHFFPLRDGSHNLVVQSCTHVEVLGFVEFFLSQLHYLFVIHLVLEPVIGKEVLKLQVLRINNIEHFHQGLFFTLSLRHLSNLVGKELVRFDSRVGEERVLILLFGNLGLKRP